ncbi:CDK-activating kinase assembly factor [Didymella exigua CBS 183.55]|uniref:RNA polymerase II transcription factor B subunit 3 n=1 Tax=Didymella exigua CBS 183.55 TaxID=1150837 RepID=A0A6A5RCR1_9PLEO|nr:CDK-activating kinase assembly factor [Didymella exigua CBS 183.55]KAF1925070.1 CDK-activating kinase assembly factor [Didymella exigua CBS 183.55]
MSKPNGQLRQGEAGDVCPVCKSSRYLNPHMKFLVNPECYHKMCESCVDRIFSHGPAPCPIAGCARTLRKGRFREATFEDLKVEREVDIRRRVQAVMNKDEADFETLKDYNDYLEQVEQVTWNLVLKLDVDATNARLQRWADAQAAETGVSRRTYEPDPAASSAAGVVLKKGGQRRAELAAGHGADAGAATDRGFSFHGLKKKVAPPPEVPFDAFGGWSVGPRLYALQPDYDADWLTQHKGSVEQRAGGYQWGDFYSRALQDALAGLAVFIGEEIRARDVPSVDASVGTQHAAAAAAAAPPVHMDHVF